MTSTPPTNLVAIGSDELLVINVLANKFTPLLCDIIRPGAGPIEPLPEDNFESFASFTAKSKQPPKDDLEVTMTMMTPTPAPTAAAEPKAKVTKEPATEVKPPALVSPTKNNASLIPSKKDPMDESFLERLYTKREKGRINSSHIIIRRDVLEIRRTLSGRVFFQCGYCKHVPRNERAKVSSIAPQRLDRIYPGVVRFMMNHVGKCEHLPDSVNALKPKSTRNPNKGAKDYWVKSAMMLGLHDDVERKSIAYCKPNTTK